MKKLVVGLLSLTFATAVYARCTTNTITTPDGRMMVCTTCCYNGNCTTNCF